MEILELFLFRNWLSGSTPAAADAPPPQQPAEWMSLRYGLCDQTRVGLSVWLAPDHQHVAVADSLGRVMLVDCARGIAVRVWKGYREAKCSFVQVNEQVSKSATIDRRHALFLVIFAPRRSCLEIWAMQRGPKVAAFSVPRGGQLIGNQHSLMGVTSGRVKYPSDMCLFLDPNGELKKLTIPFHCALNDGNSGTAKDLHLLKRIKLCLRNSDVNNVGDDQSVLGEVSLACAGFQTDAIRVKCIEVLVKNSKISPNILKEALTKLIESQTIYPTAAEDKSAHQIESNYPDGTELGATEHLKQQLLAMARNYLGLVDFYLYLTDPRADMSKSGEPVKLNLSETELENVQKFIDLRLLEVNDAELRAHTSRVTFDEAAKSSDFVDYLAIFDCTEVTQTDSEAPEIERINQDDEYKSVSLKEKYFKSFAGVGQRMFGQFMDRGKTMHEFVEHASCSGLSSVDLMRLFMLYWLDRPFKYTDR